MPGVSEYRCMLQVLMPYFPSSNDIILRLTSIISTHWSNFSSSHWISSLISSYVDGPWAYICEIDILVSEFGLVDGYSPRLRPFSLMR